MQKKKIVRIKYQSNIRSRKISRMTIRKLAVNWKKLEKVSQPWPK